MPVQIRNVLHFSLEIILELNFLNLTSCKLCPVFLGLAATDSRTFDAGLVDPWCSFPDVNDNSRLLWSKLSRYIVLKVIMYDYIWCTCTLN